jgi:hypothetical protein
LEVFIKVLKIHQFLKNRRRKNNAKAAIENQGEVPIPNVSALVA